MASHPTAGNICKQCLTARTRDWALANPVAFARRKFDFHLRKQYNLTIEDYDALLIKQNGTCAICDRQAGFAERNESLHVDHDHSSGEVRGLLCYLCNTGLGNFHDRQDLLFRAADYLAETQILRELPPDVTAAIEAQLR